MYAMPCEGWKWVGREGEGVAIAFHTANHLTLKSRTAEHLVDTYGLNPSKNIISEEDLYERPG